MDLPRARLQYYYYSSGLSRRIFNNLLIGKGWRISKIGFLPPSSLTGMRLFLCQFITLLP
ncbi:hypothetical protein NC651_007386 [Populus alba x Populus x berolinensis]|nr:hypothetical protein NC651_007386 [Populus alba x Populus x berolinensis]